MQETWQEQEQFILYIGIICFIAAVLLNYLDDE